MHCKTAQMHIAPHIKCKTSNPVLVQQDAKTVSQSQQSGYCSNGTCHEQSPNKLVALGNQTHHRVLCPWKEHGSAWPVINHKMSSLSNRAPGHDAYTSVPCSGCMETIENKFGKALQVDEGTRHRTASMRSTFNLFGHMDTGTSPWWTSTIQPLLATTKPYRMGEIIWWMAFTVLGDCPRPSLDNYPVAQVQPSLDFSLDLRAVGGVMGYVGPLQQRITPWVVVPNYTSFTPWWMLRSQWHTQVNHNSFPGMHYISFDNPLQWFSNTHWSLNAFGLHLF